MSRKFLVTFTNLVEIEEMDGDETYFSYIGNQNDFNDPTSYLNVLPHLLDRIFDGEHGEDYKVTYYKKMDKESIYEVEYDGELDFNDYLVTDRIYEEIEEYLLEYECLDEDQHYMINNDRGVYKIKEI